MSMPDAEAPRISAYRRSPGQKGSVQAGFGDFGFVQSCVCKVCTVQIGASGSQTVEICDSISGRRLEAAVCRRSIRSPLSNEPGVFAFCQWRNPLYG
jgi:hypothetical protein